MSKGKRFLRTPIVTGILAIVAVALLLTGTIGGTRAALQATSEEFHSAVDLDGIYLQITENGKAVSGGKLTALLGEDTSLQLGKSYEDRMAVVNTSSPAAEYVRVTIYRYWTDSSGAKRLDLDPKLIELQPGDGWSIDANAPSESGERVVLYRAAPLASGASSVFCTGFRVKNDIAKVIKISDGVATYAYDGVNCVIEVVADAVQTGSAVKAQTSAWGDPIG
ncbi:MAG: hypothetical protein IJ594_01080 [Oscillospiraceae bacterium]|nr:hypothetical protein [Oscillospiraceae bacterium]